MPSSPLREGASIVIGRQWWTIVEKIIHPTEDAVTLKLVPVFTGRLKRRPVTNRSRKKR